MTAYSQFVYHFEVDADSMRIRVSSYDRDKSGQRIDGSNATTEWIDMFKDPDRKIPNLPISDIPDFAAAMPLVTSISIAFGKIGNVIDSDAVV